MKRKPEILAPAGSMEALKAAVGAGADAVYLGGSMFGARAYADNFNEQSLIEGIEYCHLYGVKVYLTVNTLFRNEEISKLFNYIKPYYLAGLDAVIVQDLGVMKWIHECFPDLPIHASTQMTITTPYAFDMLKNYGVTRVVPSRELSNEELLAMKRMNESLELEVFVQGALCYCYSGQCLMSSFLGGRSGNRGRCAQPCRLPYDLFDEFGKRLESKGAYLLSPKDLSGLTNVRKLMEMGIDSFKIEGRMKKPLYVAACVRAYRNIVDACYENRLSEEMIHQYKREMASIFNRGGFTKGYFETHNGIDMMSVKQPGNMGVPVGKVISKNKNQIRIALNERVHKGDMLVINTHDEEIRLTSNVNGLASENIWLNAPKVKMIPVGTILYRMQDALLEKELMVLVNEDKKIRLKGTISFVTGQEAVFSLKYGNFCISQKGKHVEPATKQPLSAAVVKDKICQLGNTRYEILDLDVDISEDAFYSMKDLKELRRLAIECMEETVIKSFRRVDNTIICSQESIKEDDIVSKKIWETPIVEISSFEQFEIIKSYENVKDVYLDLQYFSNEDIIRLLKENILYCFWIVLPAIFRTEAFSDVDNILSVKADNLKGIVVRNLDEYGYLYYKAYKKEIVADYSLYVMNAKAGEVVKGQVSIPVELNEKEIINLCPSLRQKQMCVYGYQQLMVSAQCVCNHTVGCKKNNSLLILKDRYHKEFYSKSICKYCYSVIYNGLPTVLYDIVSCDIKNSGIRPLLHFTIETKEEMKDVLDCFMCGTPYKGKRTKGHFSRGVE